MLRFHVFPCRWPSGRAFEVFFLALAWAWGWWTAPTSAQDRWTTPYPGLRYLFRRAPGPQEIHVLVVDLCAPGVSLRATESSERRQTVPSFGSAVGAEAAINGDFFSYETYEPIGAAMGRGLAWGPGDSGTSGFIALGRERVLLSPTAEVVRPLPSWMREVVGGHPDLLREGAIVADSSELCTVRHPRTAVGLSADRHTLYLLVVDGRSSSSIGMTCAEEAALLRELGAHHALNLDGGGSSTLWIRSMGVVNRPSDGTPRVVANHLAVQASGSGLPGSCMPWEPEEVVWNAQALEEGGTSDIDGDGRADVCARAPEGIRCALADGSGFAAPWAGPALSDASGWGRPQYWSTIAMGDIDGDGRSDLCARGSTGVRCWRSTGRALSTEAIAGPPLSDGAGWDRPEYYATLRLADVDGDGDDDLCARSSAGFRCWRSVAGGFRDDFEPLAAMSDAAGWNVVERWGSIRMGDIDGDGSVDVCGTVGEGFDCWRSTGSRFDPRPIVGPRWADSGGWREHRYFGTIRVVDVDGDGRADVCARSARDARCHLSNGSGFGAPIGLPALSDAEGWNDYPNYSTIRFGDIDGDGDRDLCARADTGIVCWPFEGDRWGAPIAGPALSDDSGWNYAAHYRTIRLADVDGDGDDDLCARASARLYCWLAEGGALSRTRVDGPEWSNALGWVEPGYHATIRIAGPRRARPPWPRPDGGMPMFDGGMRWADGGTPMLDGGTSLEDGGGSPAQDAGPESASDAGPESGSDGGTHASDAGPEREGDGAVPASDAGSVSPAEGGAGADDAGPRGRRGPVAGSCSCRIAGAAARSGPEPWSIAWVLVALARSRRRRTRGGPARHRSPSHLRSMPIASSRDAVSIAAG
jgi:hypothetical protein